MSPYFAPNGAVVTEATGDHQFRVRPAHWVPEVVVDLDVTVNGQSLVCFPPLWICTDDERREACELARAAVAMYRKSVREGVQIAS